MFLLKKGGGLMKKRILMIVVILLCLMVTFACRNQSGGRISEKRTVDFFQLYDNKAGRFSLDGYHPASHRDDLVPKAGFMEYEPVLFHGLSANVTYQFHQNRLYGVSYRFITNGMVGAQWAKTVTALYDNLSNGLTGLPKYQLGHFGENQSVLCHWYAMEANQASMLTFRATPVQGSDKPSQPSIMISIVYDIPGDSLATTSYRAHFKPAKDEMINVTDWIPSIFVQLMYATADNFTRKVIYDFNDAYLRYGTIVKLIKIQKKLNQQGYSLKICDAFRPVAAQFKLWEAVPNSTFVANPYTGYSTHSKGNTLDVTLVTIAGNPIEMPTPVDTFSPQADRDYSDVSKEAAKNAMILQNAMVQGGFRFNPYEWWHYYDTVAYPVAKDFVPTE
jgi:zinc D-Ala-D-Ala dipeptidase